MSLKKTVIVSVFFHFFFFTAALLLSANLFEGSSKIHNERVFFVKLTEDTGRAGIEDPVIKVEGPETKKPGQTSVEVRSVNKNDLTAEKESAVKTEKPVNENAGESEAEDVPAINIQNQAVLVETPAIVKDSYDLNTEEAVKSLLLSGHENGEAEGVNIPSASMEIVKDDGNFSIGAGGLSPGLIETIRRSIERAKTYPILARKRSIEGTVYISFRVSRQGEARDIKILKSSGYRILDKTTLDILRKAAPFPHLDSPIEVPVVFKLKN